MILTGEKPKNWEQNLSHCHFVHHKFQWTGVLSNPVLRGESSANSSFSHGKACLVGYDAVYLGDKFSIIVSLTRYEAM
jgi:hypothetical protein